MQGLRRLLRQNKLSIGGSVEFLGDASQRETWLKELESIDWNVFSEGPPHGKSNPANVIKYLARYLTGGPIADSRIIEADDDEVHFWARPKKSIRKQRGMNQPEPFRLNGRQFMQRWSLHILPKGFTRSRCYGGYHGSKRASYLEQSRKLLTAVGHKLTEDETKPDAETLDVSREPNCPHCDSNLTLIHSERRPSWRIVFERDIYTQNIYSPQHHLGSGRSPP